MFLQNIHNQASRFRNTKRVSYISQMWSQMTAVPYSRNMLIFGLRDGLSR